MRVTVSRSSADLQLKVIYAALGSALGVWIPFIALALSARGFDALHIGLLLACTSLGTLFAAPIWSSVADRSLGSAWSLRLALGAGACAAAALSFTGSRFLVTAVLFAAIGTTLGPGAGLLDSMALGHLGAGGASRYGAFRVFGSIGWAVTVVSLGAILEHVQLDVVFPLEAAALLVWVAATARFPQQRPVHRPARASRFGSAVDALSSSPHLCVYLGGLLLLTVGTYAAWSFLPLRIIGTGGGPFLAGLGPGVAAVVEVPVMLMTARVIRTYGLRACFLCGASVYAIQMVLWAIATSPVVLALVLFARGIGYAFAYVASVRIASELAPPHLQNAAQLLNSMTTLGIAPLIASVMGGAVYSSFGAAPLFFTCAALVLAGAGIVWKAMAGVQLSNRSTGARVPPTPEAVDPEEVVWTR